MRQCVGAFIFDEALPQCYRHNERSLCLLHDDFSSLIDYMYVESLVQFCAVYSPYLTA